MKRKASHSSSLGNDNEVKADNNRLISILSSLGNSEKSAGEKYKAIAYFNAVRSIKACKFPIISGAQAAKELDGIGKRIAAKIDEILKTGQLNRLNEDLKDPRRQALNDLTRVYGIGNKFAAKLYEEHCITNVEQLKDHKYLLSAQQKIGLELLNDLETKIPREEMKLLDEFMHSQLDLVSNDLELVICGSYRRGAVVSGDIDCLLTSKSWCSTEQPDKPNAMNKYIAHLKQINFITHELALGPKKFMVN
jgi:DNA polymerase/3'-5' exonuclease PolX